MPKIHKLAAPMDLACGHYIHVYPANTWRWINVGYRLDIGRDVGDLNTTLYQRRNSDLIPTSNLDVELTLWFGLICMFFFIKFIHFMINYVRKKCNIIFILLRFNINSIEFIYSSCFPCLCPRFLKLDFA